MEPELTGTTYLWARVVGEWRTPLISPKLSYSQFKSTMADLAGNSIQRALNLGTFSNRTFSARDRIGGGDRSDVFKIRFARSSYMALSLIGLQEDADIALYDKRGNLRRIYDNQGTQSELVAGPIRKGVYYVQVFSSSPDETPYRLRLHTVELPPALLGESDRPSTGNETLPRPVVSPLPALGRRYPAAQEPAHSQRYPAIPLRGRLIWGCLTTPPAP